MNWETVNSNLESLLFCGLWEVRLCYRLRTTWNFSFKETDNWNLFRPGIFNFIPVVFSGVPDSQHRRSNETILPARDDKNYNT